MPQRGDGGLNNRQSRSSLGVVYGFSVTGPAESRSDGSNGGRDCRIGPSYRLTYRSDTLYGRALSADSPYGGAGRQQQTIRFIGQVGIGSGARLPVHRSGQFASAAPTGPFSGDSFVYAKSISSFHLTASRASFYGLFQAIGTKNTMV